MTVKMFCDVCGAEIGGAQLGVVIQNETPTASNYVSVRAGSSGASADLCAQHLAEFIKAQPDVIRDQLTPPKPAP